MQIKWEDWAKDVMPEEKSVDDRNYMAQELIDNDDDGNAVSMSIGDSMIVIERDEDNKIVAVYDVLIRRIGYVG